MRDVSPKSAGKANEENSVTFSLTALMAQGTQAPTTRKGATSKDDSGLIDLNALTAMEDNATKNAAPPALAVMPAHMGLFPLDNASALTAPAATATDTTDLEMPKKPSRSWIWIVGGVAVAAVAAFFIGMNAGGGGHAESTPGTSTSAAPAALESTKADETPKVAAVDPGAPKEAVKETPKEAPKEAPKTTVVAKAPSGPPKSAAPKAEAPKEAPKAEERKGPPGDPCKGDLLCAMQRATKK